MHQVVEPEAEHTKRTIRLASRGYYHKLSLLVLSTYFMGVILPKVVQRQLVVRSMHRLKYANVSQWCH